MGGAQAPLLGGRMGVILSASVFIFEILEAMKIFNSEQRLEKGEKKQNCQCKGSTTLDKYYCSLHDNFHNIKTILLEQ